MNHHLDAVVETAEGCECPLETVRGHVVRERPAPGDREGGAPGVAPVTAKERSCSLAVAAPRLPYKVPVTRFTHSFAVLYVRLDFARPALVILRA
jgi:hypothetical protein